MPEFKNKTFAGVVSIAMLGISALFISPNLTGFSVAGVEQATTNIFGVAFFIVGLIATAVYFWHKKE